MSRRLSGRSLNEQWILVVCTSAEWFPPICCVSAGLEAILGATLWQCHLVQHCCVGRFYSGAFTQCEVPLQAAMAPVRDV